MKLKKTRKIISVLLIFALFLLLNHAITNKMYFESTMYSSYNLKTANIDKIEGNKNLVVGGSATNLGFNSTTFEKQSGLPTVNLAIAAGVPLRVYLKMAEVHAKRGDNVFLILENHYWTSDYWVVDESYADMVQVNKELKTTKNILDSGKAVYIECFRNFSRLNDVINFWMQETMDEASIYVADSVDEHGDFVLHKGKKAEYKRNMKEATFAENEETMQEIVSFINNMQKKGVNVYVSYAPQDGRRIENYEDFFGDLQTVVEKYIPEKYIIGTPFDFHYDESWFYDTEYHLRYEYKADYTKDLYALYSKKTED